MEQRCAVNERVEQQSESWRIFAKGWKGRRIQHLLERLGFLRNPELSHPASTMLAVPLDCVVYTTVFLEGELPEINRFEDERLKSWHLSSNEHIPLAYVRDGGGEPSAGLNLLADLDKVRDDI